MKLFLGILVFVAVLLLSLGAYLFLYEPEYAGPVETEERPQVFAHRGFGNHAPDNSLVGARIALSHQLDGVDVDAQYSKDGEVVIFHDVSLERFTTGEGRVDAHTLAELRTYDLGEKFGQGFKDVRIATFDEFVEEVVPEAFLMVELKVASAGDTGIEKKVVESLASHDAFERVFISSFNPLVLWRLKQIDPRVQTVFIFMDSGWDPERVAATKEEDRVSLPWYLRNEFTRRAIRKLISPDALSVNQYVDERTIDLLIEKGYPVFLWSLNTDESLQAALSKKPYGLISDEPLLAKSARDATSD